MIKEMETWPSSKFGARFEHASAQGNLFATKLAYGSAKAYLLGKIYCRMTRPMTSDEGVCPMERLCPQLHRPLQVEALCVAAAQNNHAMVEFFVEQGVDIQGTSPSVPLDHCFEKLRYFSQEGNLDVVTDSDFLQFPAAAWVTPLYASAQWGSEKTMRLLLQHGASPNSVSFDHGRTALFGVVRSLPRCDEDKATHIANMLAKIRLLLDYHADLMARGEFDETVLHCAADRGYTEVLQYLLDVEPRLGRALYKGLNLLQRTSLGSHSAATRMLLEKHILDVNYISPEYSTRDMCSYSALSRAVSGQYSNTFRSNESRNGTVQVLLEYGADVNCAGQKVSPLLLAIDRNDLGIVHMLLQAGADVERTFAGGCTTLESCMASVLKSETKLPILHLLLHFGANPNRHCSYGTTPLIAAITSPGCGRAETKHGVLEALLDHGADLSMADTEGRTPIDVFNRVGESSNEKLGSLQVLQPYSQGRLRQSFDGTIRDHWAQVQVEMR